MLRSGSRCSRGTLRYVGQNTLNDAHVLLRPKWSDYRKYTRMFDAKLSIQDFVELFYENVNRHRMERRELRPGEEVENVVLEFNPAPQHDMLVACLWSRWTAPEERELLSTDEPPAEVAAAGHDRCIVPIKPKNADAWLNPSKDNLAALYAILDDRARPYYEHRLAA